MAAPFTTTVIGRATALERTFRHFGLPTRIPGDNRVPFAASSPLGRLSQLALWWTGLPPVRSGHGPLRTWQGTKKMLGVGGSFDVQKDYKPGGADLIYERPLAGGRQGATLQVGRSRVDRGGHIAALPKQDVILLEGGYHLHGGRFTPFFQYNARDFDRAALADQQTYQVSVAFWLKGHARNV